MGIACGYYQLIKCYNNNMTSLEQPIRITGIHTYRVYDTSSFEAKVLDFLIQQLVTFRFSIPSKLHRRAYMSLTGMLKRYMKREEVIKNLITTAGRSVLAQRLANTTTYTGIINYGVLGSSATAVANGDTQLTAEVFRKVVASASYTTNVAFIDFFYSKTDTNGTYQEFGTVIDGTASANTGQLFTHALTGGWTKTSSESMTVSCTYTIT